MPTWVVVALVAAAVLVVTWGLLALLATRLPAGLVRDLVSIVPDSARAARVLARDPRVPRRAKVVVALAGLWCLSPIDLVPEALPVIGLIDDAVVVAVALRYAARRVPREVVLAAWPGEPAALDRLLGARGRRG